MRLAPRQRATLRPAAPERAAPQSQLVVHAELALSPLKRTLEERVPKRLGEGRVRIGPGGTVTYSVERGALSLRVTRGALLVEAPVRARAEACRGNDCYASCEPEALVVAEVPLMLRSDYRFEKTSVSLSFTRPCKVRALGVLTLDAPHARSMSPELGKSPVRSTASGQLAARLAGWVELSAPRPLPLGGCLVLQPFGIVQGPVSASAVTLGARFAVQLRPELRASCGDEPAAAALPPLQTDAALPEEGAVRLGMVTPLASLARAFESAEPAQASGKRLRVAQAEVTARGSDVDVQLALTGDVAAPSCWKPCLTSRARAHILLRRCAVGRDANVLRTLVAPTD